MPNSKDYKETAGLLILNKVTMGLQRASAKLCAQQLPVQAWTAWPLLVSDPRDQGLASSRSLSILPPDLLLPSIPSNMLASYGMCVPKTALCHSQINSLTVRASSSHILFRLMGEGEKWRESSEVGKFVVGLNAPISFHPSQLSFSAPQRPIFSFLPPPPYLQLYI